MRQGMGRITIPAGLALLLAACGGDPKGPPPPPPTGLSASKASPSGDNQTGNVQFPLAGDLRIVVQDAGTPASGVAVNWSGTGTNGSFNPASGTTDANGLATTRWTLPEEAGQHIAAADVAGASGSPVTFTAIGRPGAASTLVRVSGNDQAGGLGLPADEPLVVSVRDQYGNGVSGVTVEWEVTQGDAVVPPVSQSGSNGQAQALVVYGQISAIPIIVAARVTGIGAVSFNLIAGHLIVVENPVGQPPRFAPNQLNINTGSYVVWKWAPDAVNHNVVPDLLLPPRSGNPTNGPHTYVYQFLSAANYAFYCEVHGGPGGVGMSGLISVN